MDDGREESVKIWENDIADLEPEHWEQLFAGPDDDELEECVERDDELCEELTALAKRCIKLKRQIGQLTEELTNAKEQLLSSGLETGEALTITGHRLLGCVSKRYKFSNGIDDLECELRKRKKEEIENGDAEITHKTDYVRISRLLADIRAEFPRAGIPWTQGELDLLNAEIAKGTLVRDMSVLFGRQSSAIRLKLSKANSLQQ